MSRTRDNLSESLRRQAGRVTERVGALRGGGQDGSSISDYSHDLRSRAGRIVSGVVGAGLLARLLSRGEAVDVDDVPRTSVDDSFLAELSAAVKSRVQAGASLHEALGHALGERAPLMIVEPDRGRSALASVTRLGLVAGAVIGAGIVLRRLIGSRGYGDHGSGRDRGVGGRQDESAAYAPIHGTRGAQMPQPDRSVGRTSNVYGTSGARTASSGRTMSSTGISSASPDAGERSVGSRSVGSTGGAGHQSRRIEENERPGGASPTGDGQDRRE